MSALLPHIIAARAYELAALEVIRALRGSDEPDIGEMEHWQNLVGYHRHAGDLMEARQRAGYAMPGDPQ
jgi:hypothetical protein